MPLTIEDRLDAYAAVLDDAAERFDSVRTGRVMNVPLAPRHRPRRSTRLAWAAACVALVVGATVIVASRAANRKVSVGSGGSTQPLLIPGEIAGFILNVATRGVEQSPDMYRVTVVQLDSSGRWINPIRIERGPKEVLWSNADHMMNIATFDPEPVTIRDVTGQFSYDPTNRLAILQYEVGDGSVVVVQKQDLLSATVAKEQMAAVASAIEPAANGTLARASALPDGFRLSAIDDPRVSVGATSHLSYTGPDGRLLEISTQEHPKPGYEFIYMGDTLDPVTVRGVEGYYTVRAEPMQLPSGLKVDGTGILYWVDPTGELISIYGFGFDRDQLVHIAAGLRSVSESEWNDYAATASYTTDRTSSATSVARS